MAGEVPLPMMENYAVYLNLVGLALLLAGCLMLPIRLVRRWRRGLAPILLVTAGLAITAFPLAYRSVMPVDLGPREKMVEGERHITLTGWDRKDYSFLGSKHDVAVLQMANPDVTDSTLEQLRGMEGLKELDLSGTQVTDQGLEVLKDLPALRALRLKGTRITDQGFQKALAGKESLMQLDVTGTQVTGETIQAWRAARAGRRAMR